MGNKNVNSKDCKIINETTSFYKRNQDSLHPVKDASATPGGSLIPVPKKCLPMNSSAGRQV